MIARARGKVNRRRRGHTILAPTQSSEPHMAQSRPHLHIFFRERNHMLFQAHKMCAGGGSGGIGGHGPANPGVGPRGRGGGGVEVGAGCGGRWALSPGWRAEVRYGIRNGCGIWHNLGHGDDASRYVGRFPTHLTTGVSKWRLEFFAPYRTHNARMLRKKDLR